MFLLRALLPAQSLGWGGWTEVGGAIAPATGTAGTRAAESAAATKTAAGTRSAKTAPTGARSAESATAAGTGTAEATTGSRPAEAAARRAEAGRTIFTRPGFTDREVPAHERLCVELFDDLLGDVPLGKFHERKAARTPGFAIDRHDDVRGLGDGREVGSEIRFGCAVREVPYEETDSHDAFGEPDRFYLRVAANAE